MAPSHPGRTRSLDTAVRTLHNHSAGILADTAVDHIVAVADPDHTAPRALADMPLGTPASLLV